MFSHVKPSMARVCVVLQLLLVMTGMFWSVGTCAGHICTECAAAADTFLIVVQAGLEVTTAFHHSNVADAVLALPR